MAAKRGQSRFAHYYRLFRSSPAFVVSLGTFCGVWVVLHFARQFDPDWGALNLILSMEASIGMALIMMDNERQSQFQQKQLEYMQHLIEAVFAMLEEHHMAAKKPESKP